MNKKLIFRGMVFALAGEIFDNFILNHRPYIMLTIIVPVYFLFFLIIFNVYNKIQWKPIFFGLISGLIGLVLIENIILQKFNQPWSIQIFMFCYWFSVVSSPFVVFKLKWRWLIIPFVTAILLGSLGFFLSKDNNLFLGLAMFQLVFWIGVAINNVITLSKIGYLHRELIV